MSDTNPEQKKRDRTPQQKVNDEGDFLVGMVVGTVVSLFCGFMLAAIELGGIAWLHILIVVATIAGVLRLGFQDRKRGNRLLLPGLLISMLLGLFLVGLCTLR